MILLLLLMIAAGVLVSGRVSIPNRYNPWANFDAREEPGVLTRLKLARLRADFPQCLVALKTTALKASPLPDRTTGDCPLLATVRVTGSDVAFSSPYTATCAVATAWGAFERHALQPAALRHFGQRVVRVEHLGSFACRSIAGRDRLSEHASANALDIAGFVLADGRRISVLSDWKGGGDKAAFLRDLRDGACRFFNVTLGPDYNAAHANHFHLDMGGYRICR
ncbi:extensin family protein [Lacibacterium aquatile]|uniref:Extensin family protein n=1 Tax=Lacibacterium aquatile TaxID=1168082 RepID=A0ABW5DX27_9PROT